MDESRKEIIQEEARSVYQLRSITGGKNKQKEPPSTDSFHVPEERIEFNPFVPRRRRSPFTYVPVSQHQNNYAAAETETVQEEEPFVVVTSVPDPDFYNFDKDRAETSFGENQVWSIYDDYGMPRLYAMVRKVVSQEPFKLCVSWLSSNRNEEIGPMKWLASGYNKTSGHFSIGKRSDYQLLNSFSHVVQWEKGAKGLVHIYPKKGNVWALYSNWSTSWHFSTSMEVIDKYDMVEVVQDFDDEEGVTVAPLVKIPGFKTVFRRLPTLRTYPRDELFRFSHQVASHLLTGEEGNNAPKGCLELDPAALSQELLKVFTEDEMRTGECSQ